MSETPLTQQMGTPTTSAPQPTTLSYWQLVTRDFRRNRLAMLGAATILFVITVAILCPLLANHRPLYLHAVLSGEYDNALAIAMEQSAQLPHGDREGTRALVLGNIEALQEHLAIPHQTQVKDWKKRFLAAVPQQGKIDTAALENLTRELDSFFDFQLKPVTRFPAIRTLNTYEVYALCLLISALLIPILRRRIPRLNWRLFLFLGVATFAMLVWKISWPTIKDPRPYRQIVTAPSFVENGGRVVHTLVPYGENENIIADAREAPSWLLPQTERPPLRHWHWLGTDTNGRDVFARMIYGARVSMLIGLLAVSIYTAIGIVLGALAGYFRRWIDLALSRIIEVVICFPPLMVILAVQAFLRPSLFNMIFALAALWWTGVARLQRAEFLRLVEQDFVQSVRGLGGSNLRVIFLHILPNGLGPILVLVSFGIAGSIIIESALSFLGFGVPQPMASWGDLLNNGRNDIRGTWWLTVFPGLAIFLTVTCFNLMGEGVRDALDPRK